MSLSIGSVISYSAGTTDISPSKFRIVKEGNKLEQVIKEFPSLLNYLQGKTPLIINGYAATLGFFPAGIFLDSYLRPINFARGIMLAAEKGYPVIFLAQPLVAASMLIHVSKLINEKRIENLIIGIGGYTCPLSLENSLLRFAQAISKNSIIIHAYGVAEADYGCLVGMLRDTNGNILYKSVSSEYSPIVENNRLLLQNDFTKIIIDTGDYAKHTKDGYLTITNNQSRLAPSILQDLSDWSYEQWCRRTGYINCKEQQIIYQLREGISPQQQDEMEFYEFCRKYAMAFSEKPDWSKRI